MFIPPFPYDRPPYTNLLEILGRPDNATQKALAALYLGYFIVRLVHSLT